MGKLLTTLFLLFFSFSIVVVGDGDAADKDFVKEIPKIPEEKIQMDFSDVVSAVSELGRFGLGFCAGFAAHEAAHDTVADAYSHPLDWNIRPNIFQSTWIIHTRDRSELRDVALAGLKMQAFTSEVLLNTPGARGNSFVLGWLTFNVMNALAYAGKDSTGGSFGYGDLGLYKRNGGNVEIAKALIVSHAIFSAYRLALATNTKPWFDVSVSPTEGKIMITKKIITW